MQARSQTYAEHYARCKDAWGEVLESMLAMALKGCCYPYGKRVRSLATGYCLKRTCLMRPHASRQPIDPHVRQVPNHPTTGTIINVLNAIDITLPMYV